MLDLKKKKLSLITLLASASLIILLYPYLEDPGALQSWIAQLGWKGILLALLIITLDMFFPFIPFALLAGINTLLFGWVFGFVISLTGSMIGSSVSFWLARSLGQEWAQPKLVKLGKWSKLPVQRSFFLVLLARLTPVIPSAAVNYTAGLSTMSISSFTIATLLGKIPMITWESWIGHDFWQLKAHPMRFLLASAVGVLVFGSLWLAWYFLEQRQKAKQLN